ncbi:MAG TPA: hypothetical protein DEB39_10930 [Planctomycetaceae bacterium]|nr:hypothetical protein [Planctomycetaceae bacterium]
MYLLRWVFGTHQIPIGVECHSEPRAKNRVEGVVTCSALRGCACVPSIRSFASLRMTKAGVDNLQDDSVDWVTGLL